MPDHPITDAELEAMQQRCDAATKGPWRADLDHRRDGSHQVVYDAPGNQMVRCRTLTLFFGATGYDEETKEADVQFASHSRTDLPRLIAEVRRLRAELADARRRAEGVEQ